MDWDSFDQGLAPESDGKARMAAADLAQGVMVNEPDPG
jgi:hypothetical protein